METNMRIETIPQPLQYSPSYQISLSADEVCELMKELKTALFRLSSEFTVLRKFAEELDFEVRK